MQKLLFEVLSSIVISAVVTVIGWILAKRNDHDEQDRDR